MRNTALSAAHMVRNPVSPGGDDMVKVRLQGTKEDIDIMQTAFVYQETNVFQFV